MRNNRGFPNPTYPHQAGSCGPGFGSTGPGMASARGSEIRRKAFLILTSALALWCTSCANEPGPDAAGPTTKPSATTQPGEDADWSLIARILGRRGVASGDVYVVTVPRDDLYVSVEGMAVPTEAGIASEFHFFRCTCGKMRVLGQFVLADYEANDVIDSLRQGHFVVSSVGPFLLYEHPRLIQVRFQGEDKTEELAKTLKDALSWTGKERLAPQTLPN